MNRLNDPERTERFLIFNDFDDGDTSMADSLRRIADLIDQAAEEDRPDVMVIVMDGVEQILKVSGIGTDLSADDVIATIAKAQHVMMNVVMPYGNVQYDDLKEGEIETGTCNLEIDQ